MSNNVESEIISRCYTQLTMITNVGSSTVGSGSFSHSTYNELNLHCCIDLVVKNSDKATKEETWTTTTTTKTRKKCSSYIILHHPWFKKNFNKVPPPENSRDPNSSPLSPCFTMSCGWWKVWLAWWSHMSWLTTMWKLTSFSRYGDNLPEFIKQPTSNIPQKITPGPLQCLLVRPYF